jgi:hypothetical protein
VRPQQLTERHPHTSTLVARVTSTTRSGTATTITSVSGNARLVRPHLMKWYADPSPRTVAQVVADLLVVAWTWFWVRVATAVGDAVRTLRAPGDGLADAGRNLADTFGDAAAKARDVPLVGGKLADALERGRSAGGTLTQAGDAQVQAVESTALWLTIALIAIPLAFALITWLPLRLRFARRAGAAQRFLDSGADLDLFALRAMANQPLPALARVSDDPAGDWRRGDAPVVRALAELELRSVGLRPPRLR